jgi:hypothetical protein
MILCLLRLVHGLILITLGCHAKVNIDGMNDILDSDKHVPRGMCRVWKD